MDFITIMRIMVRRWMVVLPVILLTAAAGVVLLGGSDSEYTTVGSELLVLRSETGAPVATSSIPAESAGPVLAAALDNADTRRRLTADSPGVSYDVAIDSSGTLLTVTFEGFSTEGVAAAAQTLVDDVKELLGEAVGDEVARSINIVTIGDAQPNAPATPDAPASETISLVIVPGPPAVNPFPPGSATVRTVTALAQRPDVAQAVATVAEEVSYEVVAEVRDAAPIITVVVNAPRSSIVPAAYEALVEALNAQLTDLQDDAGVPEERQTVLTTLVPPTGVQVTTASQVRPAAGLAVLGLGLAGALAVAVDAWAVRRRDGRGADVAADRERVPSATV